MPMNYTDEQLEGFRKKAYDFREQMGLNRNPPIKDGKFNQRQKDYFKVCEKEGIPSRIIAAVMGVTDPEKVQSYLYSTRRRPRNHKSPHQNNSSSNGNPQVTNSAVDKSNETESLEEMAISYSYPQETRDTDLIEVIENHRDIEKVIVPLLNIGDLGGYAGIVGLYGDVKSPGSERDKALDIFSTKASDIVMKAEKLTRCKAFPSNIVLYNCLQRMKSYVEAELARFSPKKF